jgi:hypothetical protein
MFGMAMVCIQLRQTAVVNDQKMFVKRDAIKLCHCLRREFAANAILIHVAEWLQDALL